MRWPAIRTARIMERLLPPVAPVLGPPPAIPNPVDEKIAAGKKYDADKQRNETLTMWNKFVQYTCGDSISLAGMYKQRLDGDDSATNPFYNPEGVGIHHLDGHSGVWGFLNFINLLLAPN